MTARAEFQTALVYVWAVRTTANVVTRTDRRSAYFSGQSSSARRRREAVTPTAMTASRSVKRSGRATRGIMAYLWGRGKKVAWGKRRAEFGGEREASPGGRGASWD